MLIRRGASPQPALDPRWLAVAAARLTIAQISAALARARLVLKVVTCSLTWPRPASRAAPAPVRAAPVRASDRSW
jgi:hypothetical protein